MSDSSSDSSLSEFWSLATSLEFMSQEDAEKHQANSLNENQSPTEYALDQGVLGPVELDILKTLTNPEDAVPGYHILELLGRGGMGVVYRARQKNLDRIVALKTVLVSRMADQGAADRFGQEARLVGKLQHPHIIAAHDFGQDKGRLFLAMDFVAGEDLQDRLQQCGSLGEATAWGIARQVAAGLAHAAQHGVVHRDIKPANLMLVDAPAGYPLPAGLPMVKIADFGLATLASSEEELETRLTSAGTTVGSPHYMAPEQFESSDVDLRADIYALGATVYHMLAGFPPYAGKKLPQVIAEKLSETPVPVEGISQPISEASMILVSRLMNRQPEQRPQLYAQVLAEIDEILAGIEGHESELSLNGQTLVSATTAMPTSSVTETMATVETDETMVIQRNSNRSRWIGLGVVLAILLVAGLVGNHFRGSTAPDWPTNPVATKPVGRSQYLFNGTTTAGWTIRRGSASVPPGEAALAVSNGLIERLLFKSQTDDGSQPKPLEWYRIELIVHPLTMEDAAQAAEVHFGLAAVKGRNGPRYVMRRSAEEFSVGTKESDDAPFVEEKHWPAKPVSSSDPQSLVIERLPNGWFVRAGSRRLCTFPLQDGRELPELRLSAENGTAWFSDLVVTELEPAVSPE